MRWKCDLAGQVSACCTCSKWVHLRCSELSICKFRTLGSSHSWSFPLPCPYLQHCDPLLGLIRPVYIHCTICSPSANAAPSSSSNLLSPVFPYCIFSLCPLTTVPCSWLSFYASCLHSPLTLSEFFNGMLEVFEPGALNYFTFFRPILSTLSAFRNPILAHLPLSGFLISLLCVLIAPTPGLVFSLVMPRTLAAALSFSSDRAYISLNFLPPLFLSFFTWSLL